MALGDDGDIARLATRIEFLIEDVKAMKTDIGAIKPSLSTLESEVGHLRREVEHLRREVEQYRSSAMLNRPLNGITTTQMIWFMLAFIVIAVAIVLAVYFGGRAA